MNTTMEGFLIESQVIEKLLGLGYQVLRDVLPQSRTDLWIRSKSEKYIKIQVKKVRRFSKKEGLKIFNVLRMGKQDKPYSNNDVDFFIAKYDGDIFYIVPYEVAYRGNDCRSHFYLDRQYMDRWDLLPEPFEVECVDKEKDDQLMLRVI